jgi:hypothetical protein
VERMLFEMDVLVQTSFEGRQRSIESLIPRENQSSLVTPALPNTFGIGLYRS